MKSIAKLSFLIIPLVLTSCFQPAKKENEKEVYDFAQPDAGQRVDQTEITLDDDSKQAITMGMDAEAKRNVFTRLKNSNIFENNCDISASINIVGVEPTYEIKSKIRNTRGDNSGFYMKQECGDFVNEQASTSFHASNYYAFSISRKSGELVALFGNIPSPSTIDYINKQTEDKPLTIDPDYEWGTYSKDGVPTSISFNDDSEEMKGLNFFNQLIGSYMPHDFHWMIENIVLREVASFEPEINYELTEKFLIVSVDKPYGLTFGMSAGQDANIAYSMSVQESLNCHCHTQFYFDLETGDLAFSNSTFRTVTLSKSYIGHPFEGQLIIKMQKESNEGHDRFMALREEVMKAADHHVK